MLGQIEVGFVLRISLGFMVLLAVSYFMYSYMEHAEKVKTQKFLEKIAGFISNQIAQDLPEIPINTTVYRRIFIPRTGDPFSGNYYITIQTNGSTLELTARSYRWSDVGVTKDLYINSEHALNQYSIAAPNVLCLTISRSNKEFREYTVSVGC